MTALLVLLLAIVVYLAGTLTLVGFAYLLLLCIVAVIDAIITAFRNR